MVITVDEYMAARRRESQSVPKEIDELGHQFMCMTIADNSVQPDALLAQESAATKELRVQAIMEAMQRTFIASSTPLPASASQNDDPATASLSRPASSPRAVPARRRRPPATSAPSEVGPIMQSLPRAGHAVETAHAMLDSMERRIDEYKGQVPLVPTSPFRIDFADTLDRVEGHINQITNLLATITTEDDAVVNRKAGVEIQLKELEQAVMAWRRLIRRGPTEYDTSHFFRPSVETGSAATQVGLLIGIIGSIYFGLSRRDGDLLMSMLTIFANALLGSLPTSTENSCIRQIPKTMEAVENKFNLEGRTTIYVVCPVCHCTYRLDSFSKSEPNPLCTNETAQDQGACSSPLFDESQKPLKIFEYHHFDDWLASLLCRPGIEKLMNKLSEDAASGTLGPSPGELHDVGDGAFVREFMGPGGDQLFVCGGAEGRYLFVLSVDYFPIEGSTLRGAHKSCGVITMACLNLPLDVRYDPANLYILIIPGAKEPSLQQERHYFRPLIDDMLIAYTRGIRFSRTADRRTGLLSRCAIALLALDFPAGRRTGGYSSVTSHHFCTVCECWHLGTMGRTDFENWVIRDDLKTRACAKAWRTAPSQSARDALFEKHGVRDSELWRLPYWRPSRQLTVDPMHTILERMCQRFSREALQLTRKPRPKGKGPAFAFNFRLPSSFSQGDGSAEDHSPIPVLDDLNNDETSFGVPAETIINPHSSSLALLSELDDNMSPNARKELPSIHARLQQSMKNVDIEKEELLKHLKNRHLESLRYVCADLGLAHEGRLKAPLAEALLAWRMDKPMEGPTWPLIKHTKVLDRVQHAIVNVATPSWIGSVPSDFGEPKAGTIKADQWRSLWTIYIPLALVSLWGNGVPSPAKDAAEMSDVLKTSMALSAVTTLACYRIVTLDRANAFREALREHIEGLKRLFRGFLFPSHHLAFHIYDFMLLFGPTRSWWCFPFERVIGRLQNINTNHKIGNMESTFLHRFIKGSRIRQWLGRKNCPPAIVECKALLDQAYGFKKTEDNDKFYSVPVPDVLKRHLRTRKMEEAISIAFGRGYLTRSRTHLGNSLVLAHLGGRTAQSEAWPVQVEHIIRSQGAVELAVRPLEPVSAGTADPFQDFPHFRAKVYSPQVAGTIQIIPLDWVDNHFAMYKLSNEYAFVLDLCRD